MRLQVDVLAAILEERSAARLEQFFVAYGPAEAAAMCFLLATQPPAALPPVRPSPFRPSLMYGTSWGSDTRECCTVCGEKAQNIHL